MKIQNSTALILAAGCSRRFGSDKRHTTLPNGNPLLQQTLELVLKAYDKVALVLRHNDHQTEESLDLSAVTLINAPHTPRGMGITIASAVGQLETSETLSIIPGDMPCIRLSTLHRLNEASASDRITFPVNGNRRGHPVIFGRQFIPDLMMLKGDKGARQLIEKYPDHCLALPLNDPGIFFDIDQPSDLEQSLLRQFT